MISTIVMLWYKVWAIDVSINDVHKLCSAFFEKMSTCKIWFVNVWTFHSLKSVIMAPVACVGRWKQYLSPLWHAICVSHIKCHPNDHENVFCNIWMFFFMSYTVYQSNFIALISLIYYSDFWISNCKELQILKYCFNKKQMIDDFIYIYLYIYRQVTRRQI